MKDSTIKVLGLAAGVISLGATLLSGFASDKAMDAKIDTKIKSLTK